MKIKLIKFVTGEESIFEIIRELENTIEVKNGLTMIFDGNSIRAIPYSVNINDGTVVTIDKKSIIFISEPRTDLEDQYKQQFSSIITPKTGNIIV